jgi:hypothetical protein
LRFSEKFCNLVVSFPQQHNSINFLDLTIHHNRTKLEFVIYRKPTQTEIIIPNDSFCPYEHKISSINYPMNAVHTYPITKEAKEKDLNIYKTQYITMNIINTSAQHN